MSRNWKMLGLLCCTAVAGGCGTAHATLSIANAPTQNMSCSAGFCRPTQANAVLSVTDVQSYLAQGNLYIFTTGSGANAPEAEDIVIEARLTWQSRLLSLFAHHSVLVEKRMTVPAAGSLFIHYDDGGNGGRFGFAPGGNVRFLSRASGLDINFTHYTLVGSINEINQALAKNPNRNLALMHRINETSNYTASVIPAGPAAFEGLGNTISNVVIDDAQSDPSQYVGLFARPGTVSNLRVVNIVIRAPYQTNGGLDRLVGGIAAVASRMEGDTVSGIIDAPNQAAGGLVGAMGTNSAKEGVFYSAAHVKVTASLAGGLMSGDYSAPVKFSSASGLVIAQGVRSGYLPAVAGGLIGTVDGSSPIEQSFASGAVKGTFKVEAEGGLIGYLGASRAPLRNCYAFGAVHGRVGKLGGLVGDLSGANTESSYALGEVGVSKHVGGFAGLNEVGAKTSKENEADYWDTTTSSNPFGADSGRGSQAGITGLKDAQLKSGLPAGFDPAIWAESTVINNGYPYLIANPPQ